jgi:hypothetical protein
MTENLFGNAVPGTGDAADGTTNYGLGTKFTPQVDGNATHGRWRFPATIPHAVNRVQYGIYRVSDTTLMGTMVEFPLLSTLGAWNEVALAAPIALSAGVPYMAVVWTPLRYVATGGYSWPFTNAGGNLVAHTDNGWLTANPGALAFPSTESGSNASFFVDLVFEPGAEEHSGSGALGVGLGVVGTGRKHGVGLGGTGLGLALAGLGGKVGAGVGALGLGLQLSAAGRKGGRGSANLGLDLGIHAGSPIIRTPSRLTARARSTQLIARGGYPDA